MVEWRGSWWRLGAMDQEGCYGARTRPWCSISLLEVSLKFDNGIEGDIIRNDVSLCREKKSVLE